MQWLNASDKQDLASNGGCYEQKLGSERICQQITKENVFHAILQLQRAHTWLVHTNTCAGMLMWSSRRCSHKSLPSLWAFVYVIITSTSFWFALKSYWSGGCNKYPPLYWSGEKPSLHSGSMPEGGLTEGPCYDSSPHSKHARGEGVFGVIWRYACWTSPLRLTVLEWTTVLLLVYKLVVYKIVMADVSELV